MRVRYEVEPFPYVLIDELYNEWELEELWEEMEYLCSPRRLVVADLNNGSATEDGELLNSITVNILRMYIKIEIIHLFYK